MKSNFSTHHFIHAGFNAVLASALIVALLGAAFMMVEPRISHGQSDTASFYVRQTISDETSFLVDPSNVTMVGTVYGLTGGSATGTTPFVVRSNNASGYYVNISFFDNAGAYAMRGDETGSETLRDYSGDVGGQPSYNFTASTAAQFAYASYASTSADADDSFLNNGTNCNIAPGSGGSRTIGKCWKAPSTSAFRIIDRDSAASTGATSTLYFKVHVPSGANPIPSAETYTATATLTLFTQ